ncbi:MAG: NUDIX hydrolase [Candidatus Levyibacteriota bacterium]
MINCTFENGGKASLRHVTVVAIVVSENGKILLTRRASHLTRGGKLTIPGGFMDRNEDANQAISREILEETGLTAAKITLFKINTSPNRPKEDRQNVDFIFIANVSNGKLKNNPEVSEFVWIDEGSLPADEDFAFDHRTAILEYFAYLKDPVQTPIMV